MRNTLETQRQARDIGTPSDENQHRRAIEVRASSFEEASNSIEVIWTTGAKVRRYSWRDDGYYDEELVVDATSIRLDRLNAGAPFLDTHDDYQLSSVIGSVVPGSAKIVDGKGFARVALSVAAEHEGIVANIKAGVIRNISVGYRIHRVEKTEGDDGSVAVWRVVDWEPLEISAVAVPADAGSTIRSDRPAQALSAEDEQAVARAVADARNGERQRSQEIGEIAREAGVPEVGTEHILAGTSVAEFRDVVRDHPTARRVFEVNNRQSVEKRAAAITNALQHRADPAAFQLTPDARDFRGMTLIEIGRSILEANGVNTRGMTTNEIATQALETRSGGMQLTSDFGGILGNLANTTLRRAYDAAPQTFRPLVRETTAPNFKPVSRAQFGEAPALNKVRENGEFTRGTIGEGSELYRLGTYGRIVAITRQVLINDNVDAFTRLPAAFGVQAAQLESDLVWGQILGNPVMGDGKTLFHADHKNLIQPFVIGLGGVSAGRSLFGRQTGFDGKTVLGLSPTFLIVPVYLQTAAEQFVGSIRPTTTGDVVPEGLSRLQVIAESRLDNGIDRPEDDIVVEGNLYAWYMAGSRTQCEIVEIAYLEGNRGVYTETRTGFDIDGIEIKARLDVAAKIMDFRNIAKNTGA